jgi:hypothetical protein
MDYIPATRVRRALFAVLVVVAVAAVLFTSAGMLSDGEGAAHVRFHTILFAACALAAIAFQLLLPVGRGVFERAVRLTLLLLLCSFAASMLLESIGAFGYEADNLTVRSGPLTELHNVAGPLGAVVIVLALLLRIAGAAFGGRFKRHRSQEDE